MMDNSVVQKENKLRKRQKLQEVPGIFYVIINWL